MTDVSTASAVVIFGVEKEEKKRMKLTASEVVETSVTNSFSEDYTKTWTIHHHQQNMVITT